MFGDGSQRLELNATQQETITGVVSRLKQNEQELKAKKLTLEQWYAACRKLGDELLAVLTDAQRQQFQVMLERKEMQRVHLVEYSARILPELAVAQMPWSVQTAGRSFRVIAKSSFTAAAQDRCCRASEPTGMLATLAAAGAGDAPRKLTVWDLIKNHAERQCRRHVACRGQRERVVSRRSPLGAGPQERKRGRSRRGLVDGSGETGRQQRASSARAAGRTPCVTAWPTAWWRSAARAIGCGISSRETRMKSDSLSRGRTRRQCLAISADGNYLVVAHPHVTANPPDEYCFVEVCIYRLDTGELLGNQVLPQGLPAVEHRGDRAEPRRTRIGAVVGFWPRQSHTPAGAHECW